MKKIITTIPALLMLVLPLAASAHQHASYSIGGKQYDIVIGSLNEPLIVDDKSGLDLAVSSGGHMEMNEDGDMEPAGGSPATGLEKTLKVELLAGDQKMTQDIDPAWGAPGKYKTTFYPTSDAQFSYRLFGTINGVNVDITFPCLPDGQEATVGGEKEISSGIKQIMIGGGFGCPQAKEGFGFPAKSASVASVAALTQGALQMTWWGLGLGVLGSALGLLTLSRKRG